MKTLPQLFSEWAEKCPRECRRDDEYEDRYLFGSGGGLSCSIFPEKPTDHQSKQTALAVMTNAERRNWEYRLESWHDENGNRKYWMVIGDKGYLDRMGFLDDEAGGSSGEVDSIATAALSAYMEMIAKVTK